MSVVLFMLPSTFGIYKKISVVIFCDSVGEIE